MLDNQYEDTHDSTSMPKKQVHRVLEILGFLESDGDLTAQKSSEEQY